MLSAATSRHPRRKFFLLSAIAVLILAGILLCLFLPKPTPKALLELAERNPETAAFVEGYPGNMPQTIDLSADVIPGEVPLFLQWDPRWGYALYGGHAPEDMIALSGCGPTCLSMVAVAVTGDLSQNPRAVADFSAENGYCTISDGTSWTLMSEGSAQLGLVCEEIPLHEPSMIQALEQGKPIIINVAPGDFTSTGHYLVLCGHNGEGFEIRDPNSIANSRAIWTYEQLAPQIRVIWAFSARQ